MSATAHHKDRDRPWWAAALLSSAAGLIVGLATTALLVAGLTFSIPALKSVEQSGSDIGMQLLTWFDDVAGPQPAGQSYHFIDVDRPGTCAVFQAEGDWATRSMTCRTERPIPARLVAAFISAIKETDATVVILDVAPYEQEEDRALINAALQLPSGREDGGPYIIAPMYGRPQIALRTLVFNRDATKDLTGDGKVRLATFLAGPEPDSTDGVIRSYATAMRVDGAAQTVPTAPYLAALLADPRKRPTANCFSSPPPESRQACAGGAATEPTSLPVLYSLPSLAVIDAERVDSGDPRQRQRLEAKRARLFVAKAYRRLPASTFFAAGPGSKIQFGSGSVVVLGSSLAGAMDWHATPVGAMTGSEVLLNATRSFRQMEGPLRQADARVGFGEEFGDRLKGLLIGSLIMTAAWLGIYYIAHRSAAASTGGKTLARLGMVLVFLCGMLGIAVAELTDGLESIRDGLAHANRVDVLTPMLTLGLDGYVEGVKWFAHAVEAGLVALSATLAALTKRLVGRAAKRKKVLPDAPI